MLTEADSCQRQISPHKCKVATMSGWANVSICYPIKCLGAILIVGILLVGNIPGCLSGHDRFLLRWFVLLGAHIRSSTTNSTGNEW